MANLRRSRLDALLGSDHEQDWPKTSVRTWRALHAHRRLHRCFSEERHCFDSWTSYHWHRDVSSGVFGWFRRWRSLFRGKLAMSEYTINADCLFSIREVSLSRC
jgi:hypothetical protein